MSYRRRPRVTYHLFLSVWQMAPTAEAVAHTLGRPLRKVLLWERMCRLAGVPLKTMPDRGRSVGVLDFAQPHAN